MMSANRLRVWLERCKTGTDVVLVYAGLEEHVVDRWRRSDVASYEDLSETILLAAQDHCDDMRTRCSYRIEWRDSNDKVLSTKQLRCETSGDDTSFADRDSAGQNVKTEEATTAGLMQQLMRHTEVRERMSNVAFAGILRAYQDTIDSLRKEVAELRKENQTLRRKARDGDESEADAAEAEARTEALRRAAEAIPMLLSEFASRRAQQPPPPQQQHWGPNGTSTK